MLGSWKTDILVLEKSKSCEAVWPKCIVVYGEIQEYRLPPGKIQ